MSPVWGKNLLLSTYLMNTTLAKGLAFTGFPNNHDTIFLYGGGGHITFNRPYSPYDPDDLDEKTAEATPKSGGCSQAGCGLDGPANLCKNKVETYTYTPKEDTTFKQTYEWSMDDQSMGTGKSIEISGSKFEIGSHKLTAKIIRLYKEMTWSNSECSMEVKVIPEPSAEISMQEES